jgi:S-adenosylmethionine:tRNA ribosyltransferase-isomerase
MNITRLDFTLPNSLIAKHPAHPRDTARLLVLDKKTGDIKHSTFRDITDYLLPSDVLVFNKTKVFPARIYGDKKTGGKVEVVFLNEVSPKIWEVMIGGKAKGSESVRFTGDFFGIVLPKEGDVARIKVNKNKSDVLALLEKYGETPLPPYIKRGVEGKDKSEYQTVFAEKIGSAAAPTAGLHFTKALIEKIKKKGIGVEYITLHVGLGTFAPVKTSRVEDHPIHTEYYEIDKKTADRINRAKKDGRRIIACGTTVVRTLEAAGKSGKVVSQKSETGIYIYPGYNFKIIDGIVTNFHTPRSSLLALVFAFAGENNMKRAYQIAIKAKYRFFSYGDGMLIT